MSNVQELNRLIVQLNAIGEEEMYNAPASTVALINRSVSAINDLRDDRRILLERIATISSFWAGAEIVRALCQELPTLSFDEDQK